MLRKGLNLLLVRGDRDRRPSYVRVAIGPQGMVTDQKPAEAKPQPDANVFPDAAPPLAWDIDKGVNVAWKLDELGGRTRPVPVGDALLLTDNPGTLTLVDAASGKVRWTREIPGKVPEKAGGIREPACDGENAYIHTAAGVAACFDLAGKKQWTAPTGLEAGVVHVHDDLVVIEGRITPDWTLPEALRPDNPRKRVKAVGVIALRAADGSVKARWTLPGAIHGSISRLIRVETAEGRSAALHTSTGALIDLGNLRKIGPMRIERPGSTAAGGQIIGGGGPGFHLAHNNDTLYLAAQEQIMAVRLWPGEHGTLQYQQRWESNYEHSGFGSFKAPSVATERFLFWWGPLLSRGPHCPDPRVEVHVQDAKTGRPLGRLSPALGNAVRSHTPPVVAGGYLYCMDLGGGSHGGHPTHGQILITTADADLQLVARNLAPKNCQAPVFIGERMYLRNSGALTCVKVSGDAGKTYQARTVARHVLEDLGAEPVAGDPKVITPGQNLPTGPDWPLGLLMDRRPTHRWLGFGPVKDEGELPAGPRQKREDWVPLSWDHAFNVPPSYTAETSLQGTGEIVPVLRTLVDPRAVSGPDVGSGMLYTILDNPRAQVVVPLLRRKGITQWLGGEKLRPDEPLRLAPGLYPYRVKITPDYYQWERPEIIPPVSVPKALEDGAVKKFDWPKTWTVFGPLPPDTAPLEPKKLKTVPEKVTVAERTYPRFAIPVKDNTLYLTSLVNLRPGEKPDVDGAPKMIRIGTPSQAYAFAEIDVPADGVLYINMATDWFSKWYLDGEVIYDIMSRGNGAAPTDLRANPFAVEVSKGKHVIAVQVKPGSKGWSVSSVAAFAPGDGAAKGAYNVPSKVKVKEPDWRFAPAFKVIPHPPTRRERFRRRLEARAERISRLLEQLPADSEEADALKNLRKKLD